MYKVPFRVSSSVDSSESDSEFLYDACMRTKRGFAAELIERVRFVLIRDSNRGPGSSFVGNQKL